MVQYPEEVPIFEFSAAKGMTDDYFKKYDLKWNKKSACEELTNKYFSNKKIKNFKHSKWSESSGR